MNNLHQRIYLQQILGPVSQARHDSYERTVRGADFDIAVWKTMMVLDLDTLCDKMVAETGGLEESDRIGNAKGYQAMAVGHGGEGEVGKGIVDTSLAYPGPIDMAFSHIKFSTRITLADLGQLCADRSREMVICIQKILESHRLRTDDQL